MAQRGDTGILATAAGYTMKARPGPREQTTVQAHCESV